MTETPASAPYVVEMKGIVKRFPGVLALDHVDFQLAPGEVHMLLGENGAGKTTLIKVLSGAYHADEGEIIIGGETVKIDSPQVPLDKGLRFIYQELALIPDLDVARNMFLGREPMRRGRLGLVDIPRLYNEAGKLLKELNIDLTPTTVVRSLSITQQKMVEIARALTSKARVIVLDEPTDVLEDRSRHELFRLIRQLKSQGVAFIYISHRYAEVYELGDRVTILRDGRNAGSYAIGELTLETMIERMIGGQIKKQYPNLPAPSDRDALRVEHLSRGRTIKDISLTIKQGEIVGITGLMGSGKTELGRAIAGVDVPDSGEVFVHDQPVKVTTPSAGISHGVAYLPEDRKTQGLILMHSIRDNYAIPSLNRLTRRGLVQHRQIDKEAAAYLQQLNIRAPSIQTTAGQLSGGNQQKTVVAKWLGAQCKVLIFDEPTRGIDINGRREVYRIMEELLEAGVGILMLTSDYQEALEMSHRVIVLRRGSVVKEYQRGEASESDILREAIGSLGTGESEPAAAIAA